MRKLYGFLVLGLLVPVFMYGQIDLGGGSFSGGLESMIQWYQNDKDIKFDRPADALRANNYFRLDYTMGKFSAGLQYEAYLPKPLLGYSDIYDDNKIATYYFSYRGEDLEITAGYFYDQFGSGLIFRSWENRQIGINNALKGVRVAYMPNDFTTIKGVIGKQRWGFETVEGTTSGLDIETNITQMLNKEGSGNNNVTAGFSYVGLYQSYTGPIPDFPQNASNFSGRLGYWGNSGLYSNIEYVHRGKQAAFFSGQPTDKYYDGQALLFNIGYSQKGFGVNTTFRRLENMAMYGQRDLSELANNTFNEGIVNYLPALVRQHDYLLTNLYVYEAQPQINWEARQAGEIGGQVDIYYNFAKGTLLGGKYGTKLGINGSYWNGLKLDWNAAGDNYSSDYFGFGTKFYHDINVEVSKKWSPKFSSIITYMNQYYNRGIVEGGNATPLVANVVVGDFLYKFNSKNSIRFELQHLQTKRDRKNWMAALVEYNLNQRWSFYAFDNYNYENPNHKERFHYYTVGTSYSKESTRIELNFGRQRGGLICVGGVCRYVPENTGFTLSLMKSF